MSFNDHIHRKYIVLTWPLQLTAGRCGSPVSDPPFSRSHNTTNLILHSALYFTVQTKPTPTSSLLPVVSANCEGHSSLCKSFVKASDCQTAASRYDNDTVYSEYTSRWYNTEYYEGCTAIFQCAPTYPAGGISGADIKGYFADIYTSTADGGAGCGRCGSVYLNNGCEFTFNECDYSLSCYTCNGNNCTRP